MAATVADAKAMLVEALREEAESMLNPLRPLGRGDFVESAQQYVGDREPKRSPFIRHK